ncbi:MAG: hypothetical protein AAF480_03015 [Actinomycetota bacterium]
MRSVLFVVAVAFLAGACTDTEPEVGAADSPTAQTTAEPDRASLGVAFSPRSYTGSDLPDFLSLVEPEVDLLMHAGDWAELADPGSPFHVFSTLATDRGHDFVMVISPSSGDELLRPLDAPTRDDYLRWLRDYLRDHQPAHLGLANEVNMLAVRDPAGYRAVVELWDAALPIVRELAPDTTVFVTFQYERTIGRHDGWFGGQVVPADWSVIDDFVGMDAVAFTTYPSLVLDDPADMSPDYYTRIASWTELPVIFTEVGWTADETLPILPGSEAEQVAFIDAFDAQLAALDGVAAVWSFVHGDLVADLPFAEMDLRRGDGAARPSWDRWLAVGD